MIPLAIATAIGGPLLSWLLNRGSSQAQDQALSGQMDLSRAMANLATRQANLDLPYRQDLFSALRQRMQQQTPRFLPQGMTINNPYQNVRQPASLGTGGNPLLALALMGMMQQQRRQPQSPYGYTPWQYGTGLGQ